MKGQIKIEFIFSVAFFGIILFFAATQILNMNSITRTDSDADRLKAKASSILNILIENPGNPSNWETGGEIKRIGLASKPYVLSTSKISSLQTNCELMEKFEISGYALSIKVQNKELLFCGYRNVSPVIAVTEKDVLIGNAFGNVSLGLW